MILKEFGLDPEGSHIINGHMPVKMKKGENPIKANGKLLVIDGGFAKSYRAETGGAGYTLTYNSYGLLLSANTPFDSIKNAVEDEEDMRLDIIVKERVKRKKVRDTDIGKKLIEEIKYLELLLEAYRSGTIKEKM